MRVKKNNMLDIRSLLELGECKNKVVIYYTIAADDVFKQKDLDELTKSIKRITNAKNVISITIPGLSKFSVLDKDDAINKINKYIDFFNSVKALIEKDEEANDQ